MEMSYGREETYSSRERHCKPKLCPLSLLSLFGGNSVKDQKMSRHTKQNLVNDYWLGLATQQYEKVKCTIERNFLDDTSPI